MSEKNKIDTRALLAGVDIVEFVGRYVPLRKAGAEHVAPCPFHDEKTASFKVSAAKQIYHCFGCGAGGDAVKFAQDFLGLKFREACAVVAGGAAPTAGADGPARREPVRRKLRSPEAWEPVIPADADAFAPPSSHPYRGDPSAVYAYRDGAGRLLGRVLRFTTSDGGKETLPQVWARNAKGERAWRWMGFPEPRPLYGLDALARASASTPVLVVEGEKCRDAAAGFSSAVAVSWPGGGKAVDKADWSPLAGREVWIWPDCDAKRQKLSRAEIKAVADPAAQPLLPEHEQPGIKAAVRVAEILLGLEPTARVRFVRIPGPGEAADGWDVADAVADGLDAEAWMLGRLVGAGEVPEWFQPGADVGGPGHADCPEPPPEADLLEGLQAWFQARIAALDGRPAPGEALAAEINGSALTEAGRHRLLGMICKRTGHRLPDLKPKKERMRGKPKGGGGGDGEDGGQGQDRVPPTDDRPDVDIGPDRVVAAMWHVEQILFGDKSQPPPFYRVDKMLMRLQKVSTKRRKDGEPVAYLTLALVDEDWLAFYLMQRIRFMKFSKDARQWQPCNLPPSYARAYIASGDWDAPILSGIAQCPFLRPDGTVCAEAGYDPKTGIYLDTEEQWILPPKRQKGEVIDPSIDPHIKWAVGLFLDLFGSFNPVSPDDYASVISHILAGVCKHMIGPAPALAISSPTPGSGKGKIVDIINGILTGSRAATLVYDRDESRFKQALFAKLLGLEIMVAIGEVEGNFRNKFLDECLTQEYVEERFLGVSKMVRVQPSRPLYALAGNNYHIGDDRKRRCIGLRIDAGCAKPHERSFDREPVEYAIQNRAKFVAAALCILHGYMHMGRPGSTKVLGSFEEWSRLVRGALIWAGVGDPVATQGRWEEHDQGHLLMGRVFAAWFFMVSRAEHVRGKGWEMQRGSAPEGGGEPKELAAADAVGLAVEWAGMHQECQEFLDAIREVRDCYDAKQGKYKPGPLAYRLREWRDKVGAYSWVDADGRPQSAEFKLVSCGTKRNIALWAVAKM